MRKNHLKKIAYAGLASGVLILQTQANALQNSNYQNYLAHASESMTKTSGGKMLSEGDLTAQLNPEGKKIFESLDQEGKQLALKLADQSCKGMNDCKGMNSCKTDKNACAGLGGCKGTGKGPFTDKNAAVMVAAKKMAERRLKALNS